MPYPNEHAARLIDPKQFDTFARKQIAKGIDAVLGVKNGHSTVQAYRFDAAMFTADKAREWLQMHGVKYIAFEKATGKMQSFVTLVCQAFTNDEVLKLIPVDVLNSIKAKDAHPFFQAYSICHEGVSKPKFLGHTDSPPIHWTRAAVQSIKNVVLKGVKFFSGHNADNSTEGRETLGEIVSDSEMEIDGVLHHIVVGYFPDKEKVVNNDICSQESEWNFFEAAGKWFADTVDKVTGIALSSSSIDTPAFAGAKRLGMVQAFESNEDATDKEREEETRKMPIDLSTVSFTELKAAILSRGYPPSEYFSAEDIKKDKILGTVYTELSTAKQALETEQKKSKTLEEAKAQSDQTIALSTARARYDKIIDSVAMTEKMKAYVKNAFSENIGDLSDDGLKKFIEGKVTDFQNVAKHLGVTETPPKQGETKPGDSSDPTKAAGNELLDEDFPL